MQLYKLFTIQALSRDPKTNNYSCSYKLEYCPYFPNGCYPGVDQALGRFRSGGTNRNFSCSCEESPGFQPFCVIWRKCWKKSSWLQLAAFLLASVWQRRRKLFHFKVRRNFYVSNIGSQELSSILGARLKLFSKDFISFHFLRFQAHQIPQFSFPC